MLFLMNIIPVALGMHILKLKTALAKYNLSHHLDMINPSGAV